MLVFVMSSVIMAKRAAFVVLASGSRAMPPMPPIRHPLEDLPGVRFYILAFPNPILLPLTTIPNPVPRSRRKLPGIAALPILQALLVRFPKAIALAPLEAVANELLIFGMWTANAVLVSGPFRVLAPAKENLSPATAASLAVLVLPLESMIVPAMVPSLEVFVLAIPVVQAIATSVFVARPRTESTAMAKALPPPRVMAQLAFPPRSPLLIAIPRELKLIARLVDGALAQAQLQLSQHRAPRGIPSATAHAIPRLMEVATMLLLPIPPAMVAARPPTVIAVLASGPSMLLPMPLELMRTVTDGAVVLPALIEQLVLINRHRFVGSAIAVEALPVVVFKLILLVALSPLAAAPSDLINPWEVSPPYVLLVEPLIDSMFLVSV